MDMGVVSTLLLVPQVILLPFTGLLVDRVSRVTLMIAADAIRFLMLSALSVLSIFNLLSMPVIFIYAVMSGIMSAIFQPAYSAVRAQVFTTDIRNAANSLTQIFEQGVRLFGPTLGGIITSFSSPALGFGLDALSFLISLISLMFLKIQPPPRVPNNSTGLRNLLNDFTVGYRELRKHQWLWITILFFALVNTAAVGFVPILVPWLIKDHLGLQDYHYGLMISAYSAGALLMALIFGQRKTWRWRGKWAYSGVVLSGAALTCTAFVASFPGLIILMIVNGMGIMIFGLIWEASLQELVPVEAYGRVASLDMLGSWALMPVGTILTGWLAKQAGGITAILAMSLVILVIPLAALAIPAIRKFD
jgi:MFS family permease